MLTHHQPWTQLLPAKQDIWSARRLTCGHTEEVTDMAGLQPCLFPTGISPTSPYLSRQLCRVSLGEECVLDCRLSDGAVRVRPSWMESNVLAPCTCQALFWGKWVCSVDQQSYR